MMALEGDLQSIALPEVLLHLAAQRLTGILTVQGEDDIVAISLLAGRIVTADALNQTVEDGLGEVLTDQGLITATDFAAVARDHQGGASGSLADLLVQRDLLSRDQLLTALRLQTYRLMLQVLVWRSGEYKFYSGDEVSYEDGFEPISVEELLIRSLEDLQERSYLDGEVPALDGVYRSLPFAGQIQIIGRDGDGSGSGTWLSENQAALLARIDGQTPASRLVDRDRERYVVLYALYRLLQLQLIEQVEGAAVAAPSPRQEPVLSEPVAASSSPVAPLLPPVVPLPTLERELDLELRAEIFLPPDPGTPSAIDATAPAMPSTDASSLEEWLRASGIGLAAILVLALALGLLVSPITYLLPFPWQQAQRQTLESYQRQAQLGKFGRAASVYFLMQAHYADRLEDMVDVGLLTSDDLHDPTGPRFVYSSADEISYRIGLPGDDSVDQTQAITGNFLLDPQFVPQQITTETPLYLID